MHTSSMLGNAPTTRSLRVAADRRERCCECLRSIKSSDLCTVKVTALLPQANLAHPIIDKLTLSWNAIVG